MSEKQWYTVKEAAVVWRVSEETVRRHATNHGGERWGKTWRFPRAAMVGTWHVQEAARRLLEQDDAEEAVAWPSPATASRPTSTAPRLASGCSN